MPFACRVIDSSRALPRVSDTPLTTSLSRGVSTGKPDAAVGVFTAFFTPSVMEGSEILIGERLRPRGAVAGGVAVALGC